MDELLFYMFEFLVHHLIFYLSGDRWLRSTITFVIHLISSEWAFPKPSHLQNYAESVGVDPNTFHSTNSFQDCAVGRYSSLSNILYLSGYVGSNDGQRHPKCRILPTELHPDYQNTNM